MQDPKQSDESKSNDKIRSEREMSVNTADVSGDVDETESKGGTREKTEETDGTAVAVVKPSPVWGEAFSTCCCAAASHRPVRSASCRTCVVVGSSHTPWWTTRGLDRSPHVRVT